jgi:hypothetical protein
VRSVDEASNGWQMFFDSSAGGVISKSGEIDNGTYTELQAQNTIHGRIQMYYQTSGGTWLGNLQNTGTETLLLNTPQLIELQTYSANTSYHLQWTTTYCIWPDGTVYVQLQTSNTGTTALNLNSGDSLEIDLGGLPLTYYHDTASYAWYVSSGHATSPIPRAETSVEAQLFGHVTGTTNTLPNLGYLLDRYTSWASQGATSHGIIEDQNTVRAKDKWLANLPKLNPGQTLTFLFFFDQQRALTSARSVALDADYRNPGIMVSTGTLATSDTEPSAATVIGGFNLNLGAYVIAADQNLVNAQLTLPSGVATRFAPRFKITGWTGSAPAITWGGEPLVEGTDYTYRIDQTTSTLYVHLLFDVVAANPDVRQRLNAPIAISPIAIP